MGFKAVWEQDGRRSGCRGRSFSVNVTIHPGQEMTAGEMGIGHGSCAAGDPPRCWEALRMLRTTSSEGLIWGLKVRRLWEACTIQVPRPFVPQCHYLTAEWDGVWERNLTAHFTEGSQGKRSGCSRRAVDENEKKGLPESTLGEAAEGG